MAKLYSYNKTIVCLIFFGAALFNGSVFSQTIRYQNSVRGGFAIAANCLDLKSGTFANTAGGATASSYSDLVLPAGSTIVKAYLYVEGMSVALIAGNFQKITSVKFKVPGGAYVTLNSASAGFIASTLDAGGGYGQFIMDVTSLMPANGYVSTLTAGGNAATTGRYSVADPAPIITSNYGYGWSLFIVYTNPTSRFRNVTIADACNESSSDLIVNNVSVPSSGLVNATVAITGCWGDIGPSYTDNGSFGKSGTALTGLVDPTTNASNDILNSTIGFCAQNNVSVDGGPAMSGNYTGRNPYNTFTQPTTGTGTWYSYFYDADIFNASGILPNSPTPISVELKQATGGGDAIGFGAYAISVDIASSSLTKSITPSSIVTGGTATYSWLIDNTIAGALNLTGIGFTDNLPSSLRVANPPNISITGGTGGVVTALPGATVVSLVGLNLNINQTATMKVDVTNVPGQLNADCVSNPVAFTNSFANITGNTGNLSNAVTPQCLLVTLTVPITLLDFKAAKTKTGIAFNWQTAEEKNTREFIVERGVGLGFVEIGKVAASGNSSTIRNYSFNDNQPLNGISYYRLKEVDFNGDSQYSNILSVNSNASISGVSIVSSAGGNIINVSFNSLTENYTTFKLYDIAGRLIKSITVPTTEGINTQQIDISELNTGIYILNIADNNGYIENIKVRK